MSVLLIVVMCVALSVGLSAARRLGSGALLLALALTGGCDARAARDGKDGKQEEDKQEQPTPVVVGVVERGSIVSTISTASTIEAERQVTIHAESTGRLVDLTVEEGDTVKKGQLLATLRDNRFENERKTADASLKAAQFRLAELLPESVRKVEKDQAKAEWDEALVASILSDYSLEDAALAGFDSAELDKMAADVAGDRTQEPLDEDRYRNQYAVNVVCANEQEQQALYERLVAEGLDCRVVVT